MRRGERGAALLLVLWLLVLLAGVVAIFALTARLEGLQGSALRTHAQALYAAEAGVEVAALRLQVADPALRWVPDGRLYGFEFEGHRVEVRVVDESGKVDINSADVPLMAALLVALGQEQDRAVALAGAIQDWHDPDDLSPPGGGAEDRDYRAAGRDYGAKDQPFVTVAELQRVLGFDLQTYRQLAPYVTVHAGAQRPSADFAPLPVLIALGISPEAAARWLTERTAWRPGLPMALSPLGKPLAVTGSGTYSVASRAIRPDGRQVEVTATLRMGAAAGFGQLYAPLAWRVGEPD